MGYAWYHAHLESSAALTRNAKMEWPAPLLENALTVAAQAVLAQWPLNVLIARMAWNVTTSHALAWREHPANLVPIAALITYAAMVSSALMQL